RPAARRPFRPRGRSRNTARPGGGVAGCRDRQGDSRSAPSSLARPQPERAGGRSEARSEHSVPSHRGPATSLSPISRRPPATGRTSSERCGCIGFLYDLFYGRSYIAARAESSIPFLLDEKPAVVPVRLAVEQSGGKRKVSYGDARC